MLPGRSGAKPRQDPDRSSPAIPVTPKRTGYLSSAREQPTTRCRNDEIDNRGRRAFSRTLFGITDTFEGYVAFKQKSLQNSIDHYETRIDSIEAHLERKQERLIMQFVRMETLLSRIQNQSAWLCGQIDAANNAWN